MPFSGLFEMYFKFVERNEDPRTKGLPLMHSPVPVLAILAVYIPFCVKWGPKIMQQRKPFELKKTILVYNAANVVVSIWMTYEALASGWWNDYSYRCQPMDYTDNPKAIRMARLTHVYFICKLVELLDTVFFVLRKKNNQVTFLHVYHHATMPVCIFLVAKFVPGGHLTFGIMLNCFVHSVMYSYYLLAGLGPKYQNFLRLKRYVTRLQLGQFVAVLLHQLQLFVTDCNFPKAIPMLQIVTVFPLLCLFLAFYKRAYSKSDGNISPGEKKNDLNSDNGKSGRQKNN